MTAAPEVPAVVLPSWELGPCLSCGRQRTATLPVGGIRLCAGCLLLTAQRQLNCESIAAGSASLVPGPAAWGDVDAPHARLGCEGCLPMPTAFVAHVGGLWLCTGCIAARRAGRH